MTLRYPSDISSGGGIYMSFTFKEFKAFDVKDLQSGGNQYRNPSALATASLPVPKDISTNGDIRWNSIGSIMSELAGKSKDALSNKVQYAEVESGTTTDKPAQMAFDSVPLRSFSWNWELIPRNAEEAKAIENIIYMFEYSKLPETTAKVGAKYPNIVQVRLKSKNGMIKFLPAVITSCNVNYAPGGDYREYEDGGLPGYTLQVTISEIASMNKAIYKNLLGR